MPELRNRQKMVDIIAYSSGKKMGVSDRNRALPKPVERRGHEQLRRIFQGCKARAVYATAFATKNFASTPPNIAWRRRYGSPMTRITSPTSTEAASLDRTKAKGESADLL